MEFTPFQGDVGDLDCNGAAVANADNDPLSVSHSIHGSEEFVMKGFTAIPGHLYENETQKQEMKLDNRWEWLATLNLELDQQLVHIALMTDYLQTPVLRILGFISERVSS